MSAIDTNEVNDREKTPVAMALPNNLTTTITKNENCPHEESRDQYNREVKALTSEMGVVSEHLASISKMQTEVSRTAWQSIQALNMIERCLAARPPAKPSGTVLPLDVYGQARRGKLINTKPLDDGIDVVLAHCIPQCKSHEVVFNQIIPTSFLKELGPPIQGRNSSQLYSSTSGRRNSRAMAHLQDKEGEIYGDVLWVLSPLETERWLPLIIEQPSQDIVQSTKILHDLAIYRFTIDSLQNGALLLSFAKEHDQLMAKFAL